MLCLLKAQTKFKTCKTHSPSWPKEMLEDSVFYVLVSAPISRARDVQIMCNGGQLVRTVQVNLTPLASSN